MAQGQTQLSTKLDRLEERHDTAVASMAQEEVYSSPVRQKEVMREISSLKRVVTAWKAHKELLTHAEQAREMLADRELESEARAELDILEPRIDASMQAIREILVTEDEDAHRNAILEVRAGTGGQEATLFAADLMRMYGRLAERRGWKIEEMSHSRSEMGGVKEVILRIHGQQVFQELRFEGGVHRVQRVPTTESQGRIHTSTATVVVLPEAEEVEIELNWDEIKKETKKASGAGGQHVNTTDSAVRLTHLPSGIQVECQDERSQHKNLSKAEKLLRFKLYQHAMKEQHEERASARKSLVGSGDRSEKIRTYNFPDNRVKDHRINFMLHDVMGMLQGEAALDEMLEALQDFEKEQRLAEL